MSSLIRGSQAHYLKHHQLLSGRKDLLGAKGVIILNNRDYGATKEKRNWV